MEAMLMGEMKG